MQVVFVNEYIPVSLQTVKWLKPRERAGGHIIYIYFSCRWLNYTTSTESSNSQIQTSVPVQIYFACRQCRGHHNYLTTFKYHALGWGIPHLHTIHFIYFLFYNRWNKKETLLKDIFLKNCLILNPKVCLSSVFNTSSVR